MAISETVVSEMHNYNIRQVQMSGPGEPINVLLKEYFCYQAFKEVIIYE